MGTNNNNKRKKENKPFSFNWFYGILIIFGVLLLSQEFLFSDKKGEMDSAKFFTYLKKGYVRKVVYVKDSEVKVYLTQEAMKNPEVYNVENQSLNPFSQMSDTPQFTFTSGDQQLFETRFNEEKAKYNLKTNIEFENPNQWGGVLLNLLFPILFFGLIWFFLFRRMSGGTGGGGQIFNIGRSKAKLFDENDNMRVTFQDVAGLEGAKEEVEEIVDFLKNSQKYTKLGGKIPKGALLVGPPGTGKTLLAKAVAGEAKVPFFSLSGSDFVEMFVGVGASRVRDLFLQAKEKSPSIIFIDEIDAIGRARGKNNFTGSNDERENTLNQLLTEMDGFGTNTNVIVLAATNRADILDKALMRPGRFDRSIYVDLPDLNERKEIFEVHLKPLKLDKDLDVDFLAKQTPGFSGADIANVCNEAALIAARKGKESVGKQDFLDSVDRIIGGLEKKNKVIKPHEKKRVAFHEAGHATISWLVEYAAPLLKVTIVPRGSSLGAAWYLPEERQLTTTEHMLDEICATLGGRAAEEVVFGNISTGALSDLEKVTKQANAMVTIYGLSDQIGNISYYDSSGNEYGFTKPYSEVTAETIDKEISRIIENQYQRAVQLLIDNKDKLTQLANKLLEKEVIFKEDLEKIFGKRKFEEEIPAEETKKEETKETKESLENKEAEI
ncbi:MAG: ATP-dependent zinc metalloprotease FtsH [Flavobacteriaceae bacterium]|nr:ATP-dependent zinc metalloprotease FtsH [Flavobacteriaceae bacterium]